jgi:hypothetical protein
MILSYICGYDGEKIEKNGGEKFHKIERYEKRIKRIEKVKIKD